ncbi:YALI0A12683p [Yarrowia lipolytica CLIB122]|uniref:ribonuclease H n=1 Tax=Yarrowia lipolytica (strain CLIB 122 / E 150) TaxID=284591 RepID=Q6CH43_YARLI|nr:YALI0A12683p [Yarrowia lipolytica CLIB122]CAG83948.1 YALI0A12683p [Yarrowia lipolytica CLIB122]|eukprot:XP_500019.1 YALI0A12683p [Yarrowia lipolytica CLIB122]
MSDSPDFVRPQDVRLASLSHAQLLIQLEEKTRELAQVKEELASTKNLTRYEDLMKNFRSLSAETPEKIRITPTTAEPESTKLWYVFEDQVFDNWDMAVRGARSVESIVTVYSFSQAVNVIRQCGYDHYVPRYRQDSSYVNGAGQKLYRVYVDGAYARNGQGGPQAGVGVWFGRCNPMNVSEPLAGPIQTSQRAVLAAILKAYEAIATMNNGLQYEIYTESTYAIDCLTKWHQMWQNNGWVNSDGDPVSNKDLIESILAIKESGSCANVSLRVSRGI